MPDNGPAPRKQPTVEKMTEGHLGYVGNILKARWDYDQEEAAAAAEGYLKGKKLSLCVILLIEDTPIGMGIFDKTNDVGVDKSPWLLGLWVEPEHRGHGYGQLIAEAILSYARGFGYDRIYLDTKSAKGYHEKFGWKTIAIGNYKGEKTEVMELDISPEPIKYELVLRPNQHHVVLHFLLEKLDEYLEEHPSPNSKPTEEMEEILGEINQVELGESRRANYEAYQSFRTMLAEAKTACSPYRNQ